jgi:nitrogen fixation NifU-like protein
MAMMYSEKVMEHFKDPRNVGVIEDADGVGEIGNPTCGDIMTFYIKVNDDKIEDVKFQTFGCGAAIAVSSMISDMAKGKTIDEALKITNKSVAEALDGLPKNKLHCSNLGADALQAAIKNYKNRQDGKDEAVYKIENPHEDHGEEAAGESCKCPYCDVENSADGLFCRKCGAELKK